MVGSLHLLQLLLNTSAQGGLHHNDDVCGLPHVAAGWKLQPAPGSVLMRKTT
jgi:hypothetical protein